MAFLYSTLSGTDNVPAQDASELLGIARELPRWDTLIVIAENEQYPRLFLAKSCGKRESVARRGKRGGDLDDRLAVRPRGDRESEVSARAFRLVVSRGRTLELGRR